MCKQYVTVVLNGDGGDELFAGYERYQAAVISERFNLFPEILKKNLTQLFLRSIPESLDGRKYLSKVRRFFAAIELPIDKRYLKWVGVFDAELKKKVYSQGFLSMTENFTTANFFKGYLYNNSKDLGLVDSLLRLDTLTYLPDDLLVKVDIASMANALEARSPFLDHRLWEFVVSLPPKFKLKGCAKKYILKKMASKIIPRENIYRCKQGFGVPVGMWFRTELKDFLCDNLFSQDFLSYGYFSSGFIKEMVNQHLSYRKNYTFQLWTILMFKLWFDRFMKNP